MSVDASPDLIEPIFGRLDQDDFAWVRHDVRAWKVFGSQCKAAAQQESLWLSIVVNGSAEFFVSGQKAIQEGGMIGGSSHPSKVKCASPEENILSRFVSLVLSKKALPSLMGPLRGSSIPEALTRIMAGKLPSLTVVSSSNLGVDLVKWTEELFSPPGPAFTHPLFFQAKALEALSLLAGKTAGRKKEPKDGRKKSIVSDATSTRRERLAHERVARAQAIIAENLEEPLNLAEIGRRVGCSPYYLSRTFSAHAGCTLQEYQRRIRLHHAADLLRGGHYNVTQAALAVGYNSFSHFTKAFRETFGCCPGLYPVMNIKPPPEGLLGPR